MNRARHTWRSRALWLGSTLLGFAGLAGLMIAAPVMADGNTLRIVPATTNAATGQTVTVRIVANASVAISGASASITFDKSHLTLVSVTKGSDWVTAGAGWGGYPSTSTGISAAQNAGRVPDIGSIAAFFLDGTSSIAAGDHELLSLTFQVTSCSGDLTLGLPIGPNDGSMISGASGAYGQPVTVTSTGGTLHCGSGSGSPSPTGSSAVSPTPLASGSDAPAASPSNPPDSSSAPAVTATPTGGVAGATGRGGRRPAATDTESFGPAAPASPWPLVIVGLLAAAGCVTLASPRLLRLRK